MKPFSAQPFVQDGMTDASVAVCWSDQDQLLFMERAVNPNDPWSGHISFPGGRREPNEDPIGAAIRETHEEIGIPIQREEHIGFLPSIQGRRGGKKLNFFIHAAVFRPEAEHQNFTLDTNEVQSAFWIPIEKFLKPESLEFRHFDGYDLPCFPYGENQIWGLTFMFLCRFLFEAEDHGIIHSGRLDHLHAIQSKLRFMENHDE